MEQTDGIRTTANASDGVVGKATFPLEQLCAGFIADATVCGPGAVAQWTRHREMEEYKEHVIQQGLTILRAHEIRCLFTTPKLLEALCQKIDLGKIKAPVFTNLPFGHVPTKVVLPVGAKVHLAVEGREAFLLWGHRH